MRRLVAAGRPKIKKQPTKEEPKKIKEPAVPVKEPAPSPPPTEILEQKSNPPITEQDVEPIKEVVPQEKTTVEPDISLNRSNFQVYVRVKPLDEQDLVGNPSSRLRSISVRGNQRIVLSTRPSAKKENHGSKISFDFDHVLAETATQKDAYDVTSHSLVEQTLQGYHTCIVTYGSPSTGKSHSLFGKASSGKYKGLIIRAAETILHSVEKDMNDNVNCKVKMSFVQLYNEKFYDILDPSATDNIRFHDGNDASTLEGVTEMPVESVDDVTKQLRRNPNRVRDGGRSHTVFTLHYTREEKDVENNSLRVVNGRLDFADLVGVNRSTKHSTHDTSGNGANAKANKSLQVFGNVVLALADSSSQIIPYKDSKLTRLLREALGGNCITRLLVAASPCPNLAHETFSCLQFAQRAMTVVNHPEPHVSLKEIPVEEETPVTDAEQPPVPPDLNPTSLPPINLKSSFASPTDGQKENRRSSRDDREKNDKKKKRSKGTSPTELAVSEKENTPGSPPHYWQINKDGTDVVSGAKILTLPHIGTPETPHKPTLTPNELETTSKSNRRKSNSKRFSADVADATKGLKDSRTPTPPKEAFPNGKHSIRREDRKEAFAFSSNVGNVDHRLGSGNARIEALSRPTSSSDLPANSGCCARCLEREEKIKNDYDRMILFSKKDRDAKQAKIAQLEQLITKIQNETAPLTEFQTLRENKVKDRQRIEKLLSEQARLEALVEGCKSKMSQMVSLTEVANLQELRRKDTNVMEVQKKKIEELTKNLHEQIKGASLMLAKKTELNLQLQSDQRKLKEETKNKEAEAKTAFSDLLNQLNKANLEREKLSSKYENTARDVSAKLKASLLEVDALKAELDKKNKHVDKVELVQSVAVPAKLLSSKSDTELTRTKNHTSVAEAATNTEDYRGKLSGLAYYVHCLHCAANRAIECGELGDAPDVRDAELSILLTQDAKNREVLVQLKRERNLLRDVMKIMYCRQWFTEEGKPHVKRTLRRVGIDTRELNILQSLPAV